MEFQVVSEKWQTPNPGFFHHVHTGRKMTERRTKPLPPPVHTLFSLACYESITNPFIACSRRIALRDNVLKGYRPAADAQLRCGSASLDKVLHKLGSLTWTLRGQPWNQSCTATASPGFLWALLYKHNQKPFICTAGTIAERIHRALRKGQINVTRNIHRERRIKNLLELMTDFDSAYDLHQSMYGEGGGNLKNN